MKIREGPNWEKNSCEEPKPGFNLKIFSTHLLLLSTMYGNFHLRLECYVQDNNNDKIIATIFEFEGSNFTQVVRFDEQVRELTWAFVRRMVCDGQCVGFWLTFWVFPKSSEAPCALRLSACLERHLLLFPFPSLPSAMLLCASHQHPPWLQHQHGGFFC